MADTAARGVETLRARTAGHAVIQRCLDLQAGATEHGRLAGFFGASPLHPDARRPYLAALGELEVAAALDKLGPDWTVLHSVPLGPDDADIDHLVIGPGGVFAITHCAAKRVAVGGNQLTLNGQRTEHIRAARQEATRAGELLRAVGAHVAVIPLIVVVGAAKVTEGKKAPGVTVLQVERIHRWLTKQKVVHTAQAVDYYVDLAARTSTWPGVATGDGERRTQRFTRLQSQVDAARSRRRHWELGSRALAACACIAVVVSLPGVITAVFAAAP